MKALPPAPVVDAPKAEPARVAATQTATHVRFEQSRDWSPASPSGLDLNFDLPFGGAPVFAAVAARGASVAGGITVSDAARPAPAAPQPVVAPALPVTAVDDGEATFWLSANLQADPTIDLTLSTEFIPINANRTSKSPWKKDINGTTLFGLPVIRDFDVNPMRDLSGWNGQGYPPNGPAIPDPELMQATVTVTNPGMPAGPIQVFVIYSDFYGSVPGGLIRLWRDQTKENAIPLWDVGNGVYQGSLPTFPTCTFYIEGIRPSRQGGNDVTLKVKYQGMPGPGQQDPPPPAEDQKSLTVTPVVQEFSVNPKSPDPQTTLLRDTPQPPNTSGKIVGLNSGRQNGDGASAGSAEQGARFTADLLRTGVGGQGKFIHIVTDLSTTAASMVELSNGTKANWKLAGDFTFPISDSPDETSVPFYPAADIVPISQDRHNFVAPDTPFLNVNLGKDHLGLNDIVRIDATFKARLYLVWRFSDETVYPLAKANWQVIFKASTVNGALKIDETSIVTADTNPKYVLTDADPAAYLGPVYNTVLIYGVQ